MQHCSTNLHHGATRAPGGAHTRSTTSSGHGCRWTAISSPDLRAFAQERGGGDDAREDGGGGVGSEPPAFSIGYEKAQWPGDSGFSVLLSDAPDPAEVHGPDDPRISLVCLHCLIDDDPELGRGLDIAREYGVADLDDDGEWVVGDLSRLDPV